MSNQSSSPGVNEDIVETLEKETAAQVKTKKERALSFIKEIFFTEKALIALFTSWFFSSGIMVYLTPAAFDTIGYAEMIDVFYFVAFFVVCYAAMTANCFLGKVKYLYYALLGSSFFYAVTIVLKHRKIHSSIALVFIMGVVGYYLLRDDKLELKGLTLSKRAVKIIIAFFAAAFVVYVGGVTVYRYLGYSTSTYDFGIFTQMFHNMKETGLPNVTCERNGFFSHFQVHFSPVYYLLLPGYMVFPSPVYLQIAQALVVASGVIPIYLLAQHHGLSNKVTLCVSIAFLMFPALGGGCMYDIHENMFLTPFILWLFYFMEKEKTKLLILFTFLILSIKEDAFFYIICVALFLIFYKKKQYLGFTLVVIALSYFVLVSYYIDTYGFGIMVNRFNNYLPADNKLGLLGVLKTFILNPAMVVTESFNAEKFEYLMWMFVPVAFTSIMAKKTSRLLLLIPLLLLNLMSNYVYQHSITFQYQFGTIAFMFYLIILNIKEIKPDLRKFLSYLMAVGGIIMFITAMGGYQSYIQGYYEKKETIDKLDSYLEAIPEDATVQASGYFVPKLSNREVIFDVRYNFESEEKHDTKYVIFDIRRGWNEKNQKHKEYFTKKGYIITFEESNMIAILEHPDKNFK